MFGVRMIRVGIASNFRRLRKFSRGARRSGPSGSGTGSGIRRPYLGVSVTDRGSNSGHSGQEHVSRIVGRGDPGAGSRDPSQTQCHGGIEAGHRHHHRRHDQDAGRSADDRSGGDGRADQPLAAHHPLQRLDHPHVESETDRRARLPNLGEGWHGAPRERQRPAIPGDRHADPVCRCVRRRRRRQNRLLLAPLGKHQRPTRTLVRSGIGNDYGVRQHCVVGGQASQA